MPAPLQNRNAAKPAAERMDTVTRIRSTADERRHWLRAAGRARTGLSTWVRERLNAAAK